MRVFISGPGPAYGIAAARLWEDSKAAAGEPGCATYCFYDACCAMQQADLQLSAAAAEKSSRANAKMQDVLAASRALRWESHALVFSRLLQLLPIFCAIDQAAFAGAGRSIPQCLKEYFVLRLAQDLSRGQGPFRAHGALCVACDKSGYTLGVSKATRFQNDSAAMFPKGEESVFEFRHEEI